MKNIQDVAKNTVAIVPCTCAVQQRATECVIVVIT